MDCVQRGRKVGCFEVQANRAILSTVSLHESVHAEALLPEDKRRSAAVYEVLRPIALAHIDAGRCMGSTKRAMRFTALTADR